MGVSDRCICVRWAVLTLLLRFLPYIGVWISAVFTLALSFAISTTWKQPMMVAALYIVLELFTNNVVEPFALGSSAGMSPVAVIVSAQDAAIYSCAARPPLGLP